MSTKAPQSPDTAPSTKLKAKTSDSALYAYIWRQITVKVERISRHYNGICISAVCDVQCAMKRRDRAAQGSGCDDAVRPVPVWIRPFNPYHDEHQYQYIDTSPIPPIFTHKPSLTPV